VWDFVQKFWGYAQIAMLKNHIYRKVSICSSDKMSTEDRTKLWVLQKIAIQNQTQTQLLKLMEIEPSYAVCRNSLSSYIRKMIEEDDYLKEEIFRKEKGRPDRLLSLTPKGKGALLKPANKNKRFVGKSSQIVKEVISFPDLDVFMEFSNQSDPKKALEDISEKFLSTIDKIWQLVGFPENEGRETTVEENLAVLREISVLLKPYTGFMIPVPKDYKPDEKMANFCSLPEWIQNLREAQKNKNHEG
jgi:hypothetical protein